MNVWRMMYSVDFHELMNSTESTLRTASDFLGFDVKNNPKRFHSYNRYRVHSFIVTHRFLTTLVVTIKHA